jgi:hypothetical protein
MEIKPKSAAKASGSLFPGIVWVLASPLFLCLTLTYVPPSYSHSFALAACMMISIIAVAIVGIVRIHRAQVADRWKVVVLVPSYLLVAFYLLMLCYMGL